MKVTVLALAPFAAEVLVPGAHGRLHPMGRHAFALVAADDVVWADHRPGALSPRGMTLASHPPSSVVCDWTVDATRTLHAPGLRLALTDAPRPGLDGFRLDRGSLRPCHRLDVAARGHLLDDALDAAEVRLRNALSTPDLLPAAARALVGLGPGLTPSGDDLLGGLLLALHGLGVAPPGLVEGVLDEAKGATHPIARARLTDHAEGLATLAEIALLRALSDPDAAAFAKAREGLRGFGHHSGDDFLRGIGLGVEFFSRATVG